MTLRSRLRFEPPQTRIHLNRHLNAPVFSGVCASKTPLIGAEPRPLLLHAGPERGRLAEKSRHPAAVAADSRSQRRNQLVELPTREIAMAWWPVGFREM